MASSSRRRGPRELPPDTDFLEFLLTLPPEAWPEAVRNLGFTDADGFDRSWRTWAHEGQIEPSACEDGAPWSTWVMKAGRGFGKTMAGAKWIEAQIAAANEPLRIALVGATLADARRVMVEGESGLPAVAGPWIREWRPSLGLLKFRTGAQATLFSGHSPELLRGPEHHLAWCDELAKWEKPGETWDMLQLGLRLGERPRALVTTTPRPGPHLRRIMDSPGCAITGGPTIANPHVSPAWQRSIHALYAGTRLARQELEGELLTDTPGALWTVELLERCRHLPPLRLAGGDRGEGLSSFPPAPSTTWRRLVIAVDPPAADGTCGIIVCAKDKEGRAHVLADHSVSARSPEGWARAVADAARLHSQPPLPSGEREGAAQRREGEGTQGEAPPLGGPGTRTWVKCPRTGRYVLQRPNPPRDGEGDHPKGGGGGPSPPPILIVAEQNQGAGWWNPSSAPPIRRFG